MGKYFIVTFWAFFVMSIAVCFGNKMDVQAKNKSLVIVLDPGHGGSQSGAARDRDNEAIEEKSLNLKIAEYLKEELESYEQVKVYLTRTGDKDVELANRIQFAVRKKADALISLHNNAAGECAAYDHGCTVLAAKSGYKNNLALEGQKLSCNILNELSRMGLTDQGILLRDSEANERYPNRVLADYYAIIRGGVENDMLAVLVEHAFIDSDSDYKNYLSSDKKLKRLAHADAMGIVRYYQLVKKTQTNTSNTGGSSTEKTASEKSNPEKSSTGKLDTEKSNIEKCDLEPLTNYKEKLVHAVDGNAKDDKISYRIYYNEDNANVIDNESATDNGQAKENFQNIDAILEREGLLNVKGFSGISLKKQLLTFSVPDGKAKVEKRNKNIESTKKKKLPKKKEGNNMKLMIAICNIILLGCIFAGITISRRNQIKVKDK